MDERVIERTAWATELASFSRQHEDWLVSIRHRNLEGRVLLEAHDVPLQGVSPASQGMNEIVITVGDPDNHLAHEIHDVIRMRIQLSPERIERALVIDAGDGSTTTVEFRTPIRPEEVDGLPAPNDRRRAPR